MKKKLLLGVVAIAMLALSATNFQVSAQVTDEESEIGQDVGGDYDIGGNCLPPWSNTCYNVYKGGTLIATKKGVLNF